MTRRATAPIMKDLMNKVHEDVASTTIRTASLLDDPTDRFNIACAAAATSIGCALAAFVRSHPEIDAREAVEPLFDVLRELTDEAMSR